MNAKSLNFFPTLSLSWQGAWWKIFSSACFVFSNAIIKYLSGGASIEISHALPIPIIIFWQYSFAILFLLPGLFKEGLPSLRTKYPFLETFRLGISVVGTLLWYFSLKYLPLAQVVALSFIGPALTVLGAIWFLQEKLTTQRTIALLLAFLGAFFIVRPDRNFTDANPLTWVALLPILSAIAFAGSKLMIRKLSILGSSCKQLTSYLLVFMIPCSLFGAIFVWQIPKFIHFPWLLLSGGLIACAHFGLTKSFELAEVSFLSAFGFVKLLFSIIVGFALFSEFPENMSDWTGMAIVLASIYVLSIKPKPK